MLKQNINYFSDNKYGGYSIGIIYGILIELLNILYQ